MEQRVLNIYKMSKGSNYYMSIFFILQPFYHNDLGFFLNTKKLKHHCVFHINYAKYTLYLTVLTTNDQWKKEFNIHKMLIIKELFFLFCSHYHHDRVIFLVKQKSLNKIQNDIDLFSKLRKIHK